MHMGRQFIEILLSEKRPAFAFGGGWGPMLRKEGGQVNSLQRRAAEVAQFEQTHGQAAGLLFHLPRK
jgi:hypothetical protein